MTKSRIRRGDVRKASAGGHRFYVRTGEYADGTLGEVHVLLPRQGPALRGMMEALTAAVSLGSQHGMALQDYVLRNLASRRLGGCPVPEAEPEPERAEPAAGAPLLPLDPPTTPRGPRPGLRLVAAR